MLARERRPAVTSSDKLALLDRFFAAIQSADIDAVRAMYAPDAVIWHNNSNTTQTVAENVVTLTWVTRHISNLRYEEIRREVTGGGRVVQQHVLRGIAPNGTPLNIPACIIFSIEDGHITRLDEYLDTAQTAALR
ncbi:MAG: nuclear transport factor 2 family protein [Chloroflexi bacterium]|nr:nuclear transport factor 2 family protein [Chloroflexota bacterium]